MNRDYKPSERAVEVFVDTTYALAFRETRQRRARSLNSREPQSATVSPRLVLRTDSGFAAETQQSSTFTIR
jgi:hypothetical protein